MNRRNFIRALSCLPIVPLTPKVIKKLKPTECRMKSNGENLQNSPKLETEDLMYTYAPIKYHVDIDFNDELIYDWDGAFLRSLKAAQEQIQERLERQLFYTWSSANYETPRLP